MKVEVISEQEAVRRLNMAREEAAELRAELHQLTIARENDLRRVQTLLHENRQLRARVNELERAGDNSQWRRDLPDADSP